ncbi:MAG: HEAT repeat domain-containing protein [Gemmatimonadales bacterium]|nr:HEAT repeat domain-containing protein [Gemmatimonadales bacterium]
MRLTLSFIAALAISPAALAAQSLAERVRTAGDGTIRISFAARERVCGHASGISIIDGDDTDDEWVSDCERGPVRVSMRMRAGRVTEADTRVAGRWRTGRPGVRDLGLVPAREAADLLLALARQAGEEAGDELLTAATLADSAVVWPELLRMAREDGLPLETRRKAVFWLGQAAGEAATRGLDSIAVDDRGDLEVREHAVFALSQRPADEGVPALIRIARSNPHPELRRKALFWLGQSEDPRALTLFEEILR